MPVTRNNRRNSPNPEQEFIITLKVRMATDTDEEADKITEEDVAEVLDYGLDQGVYRDDRNGTFVGFDRSYDYVVTERVKPIEVG